MKLVCAETREPIRAKETLVVVRPADGDQVLVVRAQLAFGIPEYDKWLHILSSQQGGLNVWRATARTEGGFYVADNLGEELVLISHEFGLIPEVVKNRLPNIWRSLQASSFVPAG